MSIPARKPYRAQAAARNARLANLLVAGITSNLNNVADPSHIQIDVDDPSGQQSGLSRNSLVSCINLAVTPARFVDRAVGFLPASIMAAVDGGLRAALGL